MPIEVQHLTYIYNKGSTSESLALNDVSLRIEDGEFIGLIGPTGSGKSTLIQHLNGLLRPSSGKVIVDGVDIWEAKGSQRELRQKVGLVFQYPEQQVFEETVFQDIAFGPKNLGLDPEAIEARVELARQMVGLPKEILSRSPFDLSGGQLRRVAIAGVLSMRPKVLILDEPAAGLDPRGRDEILGHVQKMHRSGMTVILVSHNMEDVVRLCQRLVVLDKGTIVADGEPKAIFSQVEFIRSVGLRPPEVVSLLHELKMRGWEVRTDVRDTGEAFDEVVKALGLRSEVTAL